jgi:alkanesulfonate monooxygenase SsuD/methylene tetrahydromethanopterin reductase-like flavin-dependent oxidoreductase (luciferase family)
MRVGISLSDAKRDAVIAASRSAEQAGLDFVAVGDTKDGAESLTLLAAIGALTERVGLVSSIAGWTRTPATTAHATHTISALSGGRMSIGIGPMPRARIVDWHGQEFDPVIARMRDYIRTLIACLDATAAEPTSIDGPYYASHDFIGPSFDRIARSPVLLAATQRQMTELAGEVADGVIFNGMVPRPWIADDGRAHLAAGMAKSGRTSAGFSISVGRMCGIDEDRARAYDLAREAIAFYLEVPYFHTVVGRLGFEAELAAGAAAVAQRDYAARIRAVSDEMVDAIALVGTPGEVRAKLGEYEGVVDAITLSGPHTVPQAQRIAHTARIVEVLAAYRAG